MESKTIIVRKAVREDAAVIAEAVAMAIGDERALRNYCGEEYMAVLTEIARHEATQYSWQYALIAEVDGAAAGAIVGYDGAMLRADSSFADGYAKIVADQADASRCVKCRKCEKACPQHLPIVQYLQEIHDDSTK